MSVFSNLQALEQEMQDLAHKMGELDPASTEYSQVADRYQRISGHFHMNDGYALDSQVGTVLDGLGFKKEDWTRYTEEFSGGWQMRIALAKLLLSQAEPAAARRADEPPRSGNAQLAGAVPAAISVCVRADLARPLLPRRDGRPHRRDLEQGRALLQRQLREVPGAEAGAARLAGRRLQEPARPHRAAGGLHQPLPLPGHQGQAGAEPHQGAGEDRAHRGAARTSGPSTSRFPQPQAQRAHWWSRPSTSARATARSMSSAA